MQAVILAGGKGTRLMSGSQIPKPMTIIGDKPLIEHQIVLLQKQGISKVVILVSHLQEVIKSHFGDGKKWGLSITYFNEIEPLGTVGGIKAIEDQLKDDFLVLYGDVMLDMDFNRLKTFHKNKGSDCTLVLHPNDHPYDSDLVDVDQDSKVIAFHAKPHEENRYYRNLVNAGVYLFNPAVLKFLEKGKKADFGHDIFPKLYKQLKMYGYNTSEYLKDMGTPDRLATVTQDYLKGKTSARNYRNKQKAIFMDRDGVLNIDKDLIFRPEELELYPFVPRAIKKINESNYLAIVVTNQSVVARNLCTENELRVIHNKLDTGLGNEHAKLDSLYYCPHHPDKGYPGENKAYKIDCPCRKPKPGMLLQAAEEFNIDLASSFFVGDTERDIEAGKRAGVKTVGVMTGKGLEGSKLNPDYTFRDLEEAVDFILSKDEYQE